MIKGFIVKGITNKGSKEVKRNSKLPLLARSMIKRKIINKDPFVVSFLFKEIKTRGQKQQLGNLIFSEESFVESLQNEMQDCIENEDYSIEVLSDE